MISSHLSFFVRYISRCPKTVLPKALLIFLICDSVLKFENLNLKLVFSSVNKTKWSLWRLEDFNKFNVCDIYFIDFCKFCISAMLIL